MTESASSHEYEAPVLLMENAIIFPHTQVMVAVHDERSVTALRQAAKERQLIVFMPGRDSASATGSIGTLVLVQDTAQSRESLNASLKGLWRVRVEKVLEEGAYGRVRFTKVEETEDASPGESRTMQVVLGQIDEFVKLIPGIPPEIIGLLTRARTPSELADLCAQSPTFTHEERLDLLRTLEADERLAKINRLFERQLNDLKELVKVKTIPECETCTELADRIFDSEPSQRGEMISEYLNHVVHEHTAELLGLLAEKYGPEFMRKRALK